MLAPHKVEFRISRQVGRITLNMPSQLNALRLEMLIALRECLEDWRDNVRVKYVVIQGQGRAFCAGGDLKEIYSSWQQGNFEIFKENFFTQEYALNRCLFHFPKPYVALWNGIVMGAGLGISVYGSHRIVTENTRCAMPETGLGYFPDVGACYFLQQCPGGLGIYLGLTGLSLGPSDTLYSGLGTSFMFSRHIPDFLIGIESHSLNEVLNQFNGGLNDSNAPIREHQREIDGFFQVESLEDIFDGLVRSQSTFAQQTLAVLKSRSLSSLRETFSLFKRTKGLSFEQALEEDIRLSRKMAGNPQFIEGIRATIIDKDHRPKWGMDA